MVKRQKLKKIHFIPYASEYRTVPDNIKHIRGSSSKNIVMGVTELFAFLKIKKLKREKD
jgi:hypothetical protein